MKYQVNFKYQGNANSLRSGSLIFDAENKEAAKKAASQQVSEQYDWFKITSVTDFGDGDAHKQLPLTPAPPVTPPPVTSRTRGS